MKNARGNITELNLSTNYFYLSIICICLSASQ